MKGYRHMMAKAAVLAGLMVAFAAQEAQGAFVLRLNDGAGNTVEVTDGEVGLDSNPLAGAITFIGSLGGGTVWTVNVTTGLSDPILGSPSSPHMDLNSVNVSSGGAGTLTIDLTDTDFTASPGPAGFTMRIGGTTAGTVNYTAWSDPGNAEFGLVDLINSTGPLGPGAFSATTSGLAAVDAAYSLTQRVVITHTGVGVTSFDAELIPEPATLALVGLGLAGLAARRRRNAKA
jgi:hypothetical protein